MKKILCFFVSAVILIAVFISIRNNTAIKNANAVTKVTMPKIILDAGHGGFDGGAVSGEVLEKNINLSFALEFEPLLKAFGYEVIMTRVGDYGTDDEGLATIRRKKVSDIKNRLNLVENTNIECFVSMHQNIYSSTRFTGTQVFYSGNNEQGKTLAENIQECVKTLVQPNNNRRPKKCGKNIYLMYYTTKPAVLVECGFMSNDGELSNLLDDSYRGKINLCILTGIINGRV
ncbi:MAG: N-acetylmuramoyl-L-alanine amidase [Clostridia bacterium]|nr:N-acetylmuramoyl-L-alanine amidase [Clostridia bacterium]